MTTSTAPKRERRGLLDALLMAALVYAVYARTPIGAVCETAINVARGQKNHPSWVATFQGRETAVTLPEQTVVDVTQVNRSVPAPVATAAARAHVDAEALAALVTVEGSCTDTACTLTPPPRAASFSTLSPSSAGTVAIDDVATALAKAHALLGGSSAFAIEALYTGEVAARRARDQALRSGFAMPDDVEVHAAFYAPGLRRGPLQRALQVLAVHRLRTLAWPVEGSFPITSPFGERTDPVDGSHSFHSGTDVGVPTGTPLHAPQDGTVKRASNDATSGNYVVLDHGLGLETVLCHMSEIEVASSSRVARKAIVGLSGSTGRVTGPHLHYMLRINGKTVDAARFGESPARTTELAPVDVKPVLPSLPGPAAP
jgi:murein DD-endopeptidase MepM/ murein hydrolase activator NlpD